jgi:putative DNA primase/helicase
VSPALTALLRTLNEHGLQRTSEGWMARCPSHDDHRASLSVAEGDNGRALLHCHAGCQVVDVARALGLKMAALMPPPEERVRPVAAEYDYRDENGLLLFQVVRFVPKDFRQRRPDGSGGWTWKLGDVRRVLYRLPELVSAGSEAPVFIVEGEKDADKLASLGLLATTNPGGAGKWRTNYSEALRARTVVILPDNDDVGRRHAVDVARALGGVATSVLIVNFPACRKRGTYAIGSRTAERLVACWR